MFESSDFPTLIAWRQSLLVWARAESVALRTKDTLGLRKSPIAASWDAILHNVQGAQPGDVQVSIPASQEGLDSANA